MASHSPWHNPNTFGEMTSITQNTLFMHFVMWQFQWMICRMVNMIRELSFWQLCSIAHWPLKATIVALWYILGGGCMAKLHSIHSVTWREQGLWLRSSWSITCQRCSNYTFILNLTTSLNGLDKDNSKTRWDTFKFGDLVCLISEVWWY